MIVELQDVHRSYRLRAETIHAVVDANLRLDGGTVTGLVGPSGSGKTTLINLMIGWDVPDRGRVLHDDGDWSDWSGVSVVPQGLGLLTELSIAENITLPVRLGNAQKHPLDHLVGELGIEGLEDRLPDETSLGEQQRTAVARAVVCQPKLLVADEPTAHQDEDNADIVARFLRQAALDGAAVLIATHDEGILRHVDRVVSMTDGHLTT